MFVQLSHRPLELPKPSLPLFCSLTGRGWRSGRSTCTAWTSGTLKSCRFWRRPTRGSQPKQSGCPSLPGEKSPAVGGGGGLGGSFFSSLSEGFVAGLLSCLKLFLPCAIAKEEREKEDTRNGASSIDFSPPSRAPPASGEAALFLTPSESMWIWQKGAFPPAFSHAWCVRGWVVRRS